MEIDKNYILSVAETIRQQLFALTPTSVLMSWGISGLAATTYNNMPSLRLVVNGRLHKGNVIIALNEGTDYYEVYLTDRKGTRKVGFDLDFTQIGDFIDRTIEKGDNGEEYNAFCEQERVKLLRGEIL